VACAPTTLNYTAYHQVASARLTDTFLVNQSLTKLHITNDASTNLCYVIISDWTKKGVQPLIPQSQYVPFDLIGVMPDMKTMQRIRVGYKQANLSQCIDQYAIYLPDQGKVCYFSHTEIQENERFIATAG
jgi:hypothetical protein